MVKIVQIFALLLLYILLKSGSGKGGQAGQPLLCGCGLLGPRGGMGLVRNMALAWEDCGGDGTLT